MKSAARRQFLLTGPAALLTVTVATSCARLDTKSEVDVRPIEVKPIHITVDVNVRVDRELDQFFSFEEEVAPAGPAKPATMTAAPAASSDVAEPETNP